ncbi:MAG: FAD-linked oxidase C-terminal domain-containing protein [Dehalococcoidia bacterium]
MNANQTVEARSRPYCAYAGPPGEVHYPESDGRPMGETAIHVLVITRLISLFLDVYDDRDDVYVVGDSFLYYERGNPHAVVAPDVMVVFGVPREPPRRTYRMWDERIPPALVFEITSRSSRIEDERTKREVYARIGVAEYVIFDPLGEYLHPPFRFYRLRGAAYEPVIPAADGGYVCESLNMVMRPEGRDLLFFDRLTGRPILTPSERAREAEARAEAEAARAEASRAGGSRGRGPPGGGGAAGGAGGAAAAAGRERRGMKVRPAVMAELERIVGPGQVHAGPAQRVAYSFDATFPQDVPDVALTPGSTEEVAAILRVAAREGIPVHPRGAGSSLSGGAVPIGGGIALSLARMNRIVEIDPADTVAVVQPGVVTGDLQKAVERLGLFYPPDPASLNQSTLGGNIACNAGGPRCLKYGVTKDYVLGLTAVLIDGRVLRLGGRTVKNVTGFQLVQLFVGSEGCLGVVTEIILRLVPLPRFRSTAAAYFPALDAASEAVTAIMSAGILPATLEMMDKTSINIVEDYLALGLPRDAEALLLLEQDGNDEEAAHAEVMRMAAICRELGATDVRVARDAAERDGLWRARRAVSGALGRVRPNKLGEDVVVPRSKIPAMVRRIEQISQQHGLPIVVFGHAGDGNLHPNILFDRRIEGELARVERAAADIFTAALDLGGTLSGEHGIGSLKREFLTDDLGPDAVDVMRAIKAALDPHGLLNPHKVFPGRPGGAHEDFLRALPTLEGWTPG